MQNKRHSVLEDVQTGGVLGAGLGLPLGALEGGIGAYAMNGVRDFGVGEKKTALAKFILQKILGKGLKYGAVGAGLGGGLGLLMGSNTQVPSDEDFQREENRYK